MHIFNHPNYDFLRWRWHAIALSTSPGANDALRLAGRIEAAEFLGEFMRYDVRVGDALLVADQPHVRGTTALPSGSAVHLSVPAEEIRVIDL